MAGPMLVSDGKVHFSYFQEVKDSSPQEMAVNYHIGLVGLIIAAQLPLVYVDPNQHLIDQVQMTLDTAWEPQATTNRLSETF